MDLSPELPLYASEPREKPLAEHYWYKQCQKEFCFIDDIRNGSKPVPLLWAAAFLCQFRFLEKLGNEFSKRCTEENLKITGDQLSDLELAVIKGNIEVVGFEIDKWRKINATRDEKKSDFYVAYKSVLHHAVLARNLKMVQFLLSQGCHKIINRNDFITGFSPAIVALFVQDFDILWCLIKHGADINLKDNFDARLIDYAHLMDIAPSPWDLDRRLTPFTISVFNQYNGTIDQWPVTKFEEELGVKFGLYYKCTCDYIFELLFSGFSIGQKDILFRNKFLHLLNHSSGDENLILAKIDDKVGYGVFAGKDFEKDEYIVRYVGVFIAEDECHNSHPNPNPNPNKEKHFHYRDEKAPNPHTYCMSSGVEGIVLSAANYRNLGGFINHSSTPNAEARCIFHKGVEQAVVVSLGVIKKGHQVFINYSSSYFGFDGDDGSGADGDGDGDGSGGGGGGGADFVDLAASDGFPTWLPGYGNNS
eukprot:TRINITY_DN1631_c0_g1_i3.p1 TRINITY_DN1631_c0_g1~~TRINITY_DN1631_c0_g1_i3.p1  ORF type:complete len:476 (-),score=100.50 TRINITY_DN1631_c0_g1_i3:154-1581(-)